MNTPTAKEHEFAGLLVGITSVTVNKPSFFMYHLSVRAVFVIYRRDNSYHILQIKR